MILQMAVSEWRVSDWRFYTSRPLSQISEDVLLISTVSVSVVSEVDCGLAGQIRSAGHTKAFDYPVARTQLDIPRPLITQSHGQSWTYQGI